MTFVGICNGEKYILPKAVSVRINQEIGATADSLTVCFVYGDDFPMLERIYSVEATAFDVVKAVENNEVLFSGVVDEQIFTADTGSATITVHARSLAALLIDNECRATSYINPSLDIIEKNHLAPFGISCADDTSIIVKGELRAYKDGTHAGVVERFCKDFLGTTPRIDHRGVFYTNAYRLDNKIFFSNKNGIPFDYVSVCQNRYSRISKVFLKTGNYYDTVIADEEAVTMGICRERYLDVSCGDYYMSDADRLISNGITNSLSVVLRCSGRLVNLLGYCACVDVPYCTDIKFVVSSIDYSYKNGVEQSKIKLKTIPTEQFAFHKEVNYVGF